MSATQSTSTTHKQLNNKSRTAPLPRASAVVPSAYFRWKHVFDPVAAALLLVVGLPTIALLIAIVRLTSPGPGLFRQRRVGRDGVEFMLLKIRTMRDAAEDHTGPTWAKVRDSRVTKVGRILRLLHLDELPQLINVLKGQMSLIGPRPERPEFVHVLAESIPGYLNRLAVLPGITGLAQLNLPPDSDLHSVRRKLILDLEYVESANLWMDVRLFICTFARMFKLPCSFLLRIARLHREVALPEESVASGNESVEMIDLASTPAAIGRRAARQKPR
jgi:lipopolysaccharide/colanic/teichoic acid biosynthesis glycosyltransferase